MIPDLDGLIRLQAAEDALREAEAQLAEVPTRKSALEAALASERSELDAAMAALEGCLQSRRRHEGELQDLESKRSKYKGQLMDVKTNKEYTAMLHEIEGVEKQISATEDQILEELERAETLGAEVEREKSTFAEHKTDHDAKLRELDARGKELETRVSALKAERDAAAEGLPANRRELFERVARLRRVAVSRALEGGTCEQCHVVLRPQMFVDIKRNDGILQCPSCNRVLYYEPPPQTVEPPVP